MNDLVEQLRVAVVVPPPLEAAFRLVPRSAFLVSHAVRLAKWPLTALVPVSCSGHDPCILIWDRPQCVNLALPLPVSYSDPTPKTIS